jgi:hypothetical protein
MTNFGALGIYDFMGVLFTLMMFIFCGIQRRGFDAKTGLLGAIATIGIMVYIQWLPIWVWIVPILLMAALVFMDGDENG